MKTYKYSRHSIAIQIILILIFIVLLVLIFDPHFLGRLLFDSPRFPSGMIGATIGFSLGYFPPLFKQNVALNSDKLILQNFIIDYVKQKKIEILYGNITNVQKQAVFGFLKIYVKGSEKPFYISTSMEKHEELFGEICRKARKANPDAYIDSAFDKYYLTDI